MSVPGPRRIEAIDCLRGLALGGMLVVNLGLITGVYPLASRTGFDPGTWLIAIFGEGKFLPVFAFLFGWGIARRSLAPDSNQAAASAHLLRMGFLGFIGLLHGFLVWPGDILFSYALIGAFLPLMRRVPTGWLAGFAAAALLLPAFLVSPGPGQSTARAYSELVSPWAAPLYEDIRLASYSLFNNELSIRFSLFELKLIYLPLWIGKPFGLVAFGYLAFRQGWSFRFLPWIAAPALGLNILSALARFEPGWFPVSWATFIRTISLDIGGPLLALCYAWVIRRIRNRSLGNIAWISLARAGRMPLTIYLAQSLVVFFVLNANGQYIQTTGQVLAASAVIFMIQVAVAYLWLRRFSHGPLETAWRAASGRRFWTNVIKTAPDG